MTNKFKFNILTGENAKEKYDSIPTKEPFTFYLLQTGVGYLGEKLLFDAGTTKEVIKEIIPESATNDTLATTKAIVDFVVSKVADITVGDILTAKFFRNVEAWTLSSADMNNPAISLPAGCKAGDIGLMFTADINEEDDGDEKYYFVSLVDYLANWYDFTDTNSIGWTIGPNNQVKADVYYNSDYLEVDGNGLGVKAVDTFDGKKYTGKLITDSAIYGYLTDVLIPRIEAIEETMTSHTETLENEVVKYTETTD